MRDCVSIFQRLKLSPDERLEKYVKDHDIVDINDADACGCNLQIIKEDSDDVDDADESEGDEINDNTFPDCEKEDKILCQDITVTKSNIGNTMAFTSENANKIPDVDGTTDVTFDKQFKDGDVPCIQKLFNVETGCQEQYKAAGLMSVSRTYVTLNLRDAWANGKLARADYPLSHHSAKEFKQIRPTLTCRDCCHVGHDHKQVIMVYDEDYVESIRSSTKWWDGVFIGSFAQMASHYAHSTINERCSALDSTPLPQVMHVTYPKERITEEQFMRVPSSVTRLVSVILLCWKSISPENVS